MVMVTIVALPRVALAQQDAPLKSGFELVDLEAKDLEQCAHFTGTATAASSPTTCEEANVAAFCQAMATRPDTAHQYSCAPRMLRVRRVCTPPLLEPPAAGCAYSCSDLLKKADTPVPACAEDELASRLAPPQGFVGTAGLSQIVLTGATDFFIGRAKKELAAFLQQQIADELCDADDGKKLLPLTCEALKPAGGEPLPEALSTLHVSFREDLKELPGRLIAKLFTSESGPGCVVTLVARMAPKLAASMPVGAALKSAVSGEKPPACKEPVWKGIQDASKIVGEVLDADTEAELRVRIAVRASQLSALGVDASLLTELLNDGVTLVASVKAFRELSADPERRAAVVRASFALLESTTAILLKAGKLEDSKDLLGNIRTLGSVFESIALGDYATATLRFFTVPALSEAIATEAGALGKYLKQFRRHAQLIASIASSKTPEEVEKAIEAAAEPIGSWREFRRRPGAGFLGAILGVSAGGEFSLSDAGSHGAMVTPTLAIGMEVGVAKFSGSSFQIFIPVLDLGALAALRLDGSTTEEGAEDKTAELVSEPTFASVFAPGLFGVFGLADTPLVLSAGLELAPAHRRFYACSGQCSDDEAPSTTTLPAIRVHAMLGVDLPVFPLF